jgi:hypothetical protein
MNFFFPWLFLFVTNETLTRTGPWNDGTAGMSQVSDPIDISLTEGIPGIASDTAERSSLRYQGVTGQLHMILPETGA